MSRSIDLNADVGEAFGVWTIGDDASILRIVTSANIACGFHAGDPSTMQRTVALAVEHGVVIGAHVSYPDLVGFGRRDLDIDAADLEACVLYQIAALDGFCRVAGSAVRYVKPHGALYHRIRRDPGQAAAVVRATHSYDPSLCLLGGPEPAAPGAAPGDGPVVHAEGFADRGYEPDGVSLVPRHRPGAVITDTAAVAGQAVRLARLGRYASICLHGDTPHAVEHAIACRAALLADGFAIRPFVG